MKKILGLDIGTTSIGWAFVNEAENENEKSEIKKLGVRVIQYDDNLKTVDRVTGKIADSKNPIKDFESGKGLSPNAGRTQKRGARRTLDRYQQRRDALIKILKKENFITDITLLNEDGKQTTFSTYKSRAKATKEQISKVEFAKVLFMINKKRGYKSSRKVKSDDEGTAIDGMAIAKQLYENNTTPGQYVYEILKKGKKQIPDFYRSDLQNELDKIWEFQKGFYNEILTDELREKLKGKNKGATWKICEKPFGIAGIKQKGNREEQRLEKYLWRANGTKNKLDLENLAVVLQEINSQINNSSGYLGAISDRSKELYFNKLTVGEYLYNQLQKNMHTRLKNQVFYRQDYLDEFEIIWEKQKEFYLELTDELKNEIRDVIIFYQRRLKSQKGLLSHCEFESWEEEYYDEVEEKKKKRRVGQRVIPKSSPLFQEFKIWQILNNIELKNIGTRKGQFLLSTTQEKLFKELNIKEKLTAKEVIKILGTNPNENELNYKAVEGNRTNAELYKVYQEILKLEGEEYDFSKMKADDINETVSTKFLELGIDTNILFFNVDIEGNAYDKQSILQLWHLLYSFEGDSSKTGHERLLKKLEKKFGFKPEYAKLIANITLQDDYGSLSSKAIRKILPHIKNGNTYDVACANVGYNHSHSITKEESEKRELKEKLELLPKNSLRNPVVEKILNQMVNVINAIIEDENLGKPDEIRIELARELKKSSDERKEMTQNISKATIEHEKIRKILRTEFGIPKVTRNDIIRYKLYQELAANEYHTLYTNEYIQKEKLFSKEYDIEHIIPKARLFDDSFSNKTLTVRKVNLEKGDETAYDFLSKYLDEENFNKYLLRIERMYKKGSIGRAKYNKLKMKLSKIPDGFIDRDLRNTQYISKKAKQMLEEVVRTVNTTTGSITNRLRSDWQLVNVMKELNLPKYEKLGLVESIEGKHGQPEKRIKNWTKRNDHRHHAMDALTVAFTTHSHVQYLNNLNARKNEKHEKYGKIYGIEKKYLHRPDNGGSLVFNPPIPITEFRNEAKKNLESILISFKAKNKVVTRNKNKIKTNGKNNYKTKIELTPRGQLHKETVYGRIKQYDTKEEKVGAKFDIEKIKQVAKQEYREALLVRLAEFEGNPKKAFSGSNAPSRNPIFIDDAKTIELPERVKLVWKEDNYTIRKEISPELKIDKVIDIGTKNILQKRLDEYDGNPKKAFSNLDENPIWITKPIAKEKWKNPNKPKPHELGISIKRVTITGVSNAQAIHTKKDHNGKPILDENGNEQPVDFVSTGNNHHVAIYRDEKGNLQEEVVSFFEAVARVNAGEPIINKHKNGWEFLFTMKQNEYFIFPSEDFDTNEIDLLNPDNAHIISPHLFRVQKISTKNYVFNHHLETKSVDGELLKKKKELSKVTYNFIQTPSNLRDIIKVRINHLGNIVKVGEY